ncbi:unnamed protein product, partial [Meganyctiphanes norvegica]
RDTGIKSEDPTEEMRVNIDKTIEKVIKSYAVDCNKAVGRRNDDFPSRDTGIKSEDPTEEMRVNIGKTIEKVIKSYAVDCNKAVGRRNDDFPPREIGLTEDVTEEIRGNVAKTIENVIKSYALGCDEAVGIRSDVSSDELGSPITKNEMKKVKLCIGGNRLESDYHGHFHKKDKKHKIKHTDKKMKKTKKNKDKKHEIVENLTEKTKNKEKSHKIKKEKKKKVKLNSECYVKLFDVIKLCSKVKSDGKLSVPIKELSILENEKRKKMVQKLKEKKERKRLNKAAKGIANTVNDCPSDLKFELKEEKTDEGYKWTAQKENDDSDDEDIPKCSTQFKNAVIIGTKSAAGKIYNIEIPSVMFLEGQIVFNEKNVKKILKHQKKWPTHTLWILLTDVSEVSATETECCEYFDDETCPHMPKRDVMMLGKVDTIEGIMARALNFTADVIPSLGEGSVLCLAPIIPSKIMCLGKKSTHTHADLHEAVSYDESLSLFANNSYKVVEYFAELERRWLQMLQKIIKRQKHPKEILDMYIMKKGLPVQIIEHAQESGENFSSRVIWEDFILYILKYAGFTFKGNDQRLKMTDDICKDFESDNEIANMSQIRRNDFWKSKDVPLGNTSQEKKLVEDDVLEVFNISITHSDMSKKHSKPIELDQRTEECKDLISDNEGSGELNNDKRTLGSVKLDAGCKSTAELQKNKDNKDFDIEKNYVKNSLTDVIENENVHENTVVPLKYSEKLDSIKNQDHEMIEYCKNDSAYKVESKCIPKMLKDNSSSKEECKRQTCHSDTRKIELKTNTDISDQKVEFKIALDSMYKENAELNTKENDTDSDILGLSQSLDKIQNENNPSKASILTNQSKDQGECNKFIKDVAEECVMGSTVEKQRSNEIPKDISKCEMNNESTICETKTGELEEDAVLDILFSETFDDDDDDGDDNGDDDNGDDDDDDNKKESTLDSTLLNNEYMKTENVKENMINESLCPKEIVNGEAETIEQEKMKNSSPYSPEICKDQNIMVKEMVPGIDEIAHQGNIKVISAEERKSSEEIDKPVINNHEVLETSNDSFEAKKSDNETSPMKKISLSSKNKISSLQTDNKSKEECSEPNILAEFPKEEIKTVKDLDYNNENSILNSEDNCNTFSQSSQSSENDVLIKKNEKDNLSHGIEKGKLKTNFNDAINILNKSQNEEIFLYDTEKEKKKISNIGENESFTRKDLQKIDISKDDSNYRKTHNLISSFQHAVIIGSKEAAGRIYDLSVPSLEFLEGKVTFNEKMMKKVLKHQSNRPESTLWIFLVDISFVTEKGSSCKGLLGESSCMSYTEETILKIKPLTNIKHIVESTKSFADTLLSKLKKESALLLLPLIPFEALYIKKSSSITHKKLHKAVNRFSGLKLFGSNPNLVKEYFINLEKDWLVMLNSLMEKQKLPTNLLEDFENVKGVPASFLEQGKQSSDTKIAKTIWEDFLIIYLSQYGFGKEPKKSIMKSKLAKYKSKVPNSCLQAVMEVQERVEDKIKKIVDVSEPKKE